MEKKDCKFETTIEMIRDDLKEVRKDVKELMKFKYQVVGASVFTSAIIATVLQAIIFLVRK